MAFSAALADRVRHALAAHSAGPVEEKRMFGGLAFLVGHHLAVGVWTDRLMLRLGVEATGLALRDPAAEPFRNGQRVMPGWVMVNADGFEGDHRLRDWVGRALRFVATLPPRIDN